MKLLSVTLEDVRRFTSPVEVRGIEAGLNVLSAPNERGKSTFFDAVQALFFAPHRSATREIKALRPHAGGAPSVTVEIETPEGRFRLTKRWLSRPEARVEQNGKLLAKADAAEAWIGRLLGGQDGGPSGLLWVRQGVTGLDDDNGTRAQKAALEARRDLLSSVTGEVEAMTGGRRMDAALARCRAELGAYLTPTGKPAKNGPLRDAMDEVAALEAREQDLDATVRTLNDALERRRSVRRALAELEAPDAAQERAERLARTEAAHQDARRHADRLAEAEARLRMAQLELDQAERRLADLSTARREARNAEAVLSAARQTRSGVAAVAAEAATGLEAARAAETWAATAAEAAGAKLREAHRRHAAIEAQARRAELNDRLTQAEAARVAAEAAGAEAALGPDAATLRALEGKARALATAEALRSAEAPSLTLHRSADARAEARMGGKPLPHGTAVPIPDGAGLELEGIGRLEIRPGAARGSDTEVATARQALCDALRACGSETLDAAREAHERRQAASDRQREARARLAALAPDGLEALRAALAALPAPTDDTTGPADLGALETAHAIAEQALRDARRNRETSAQAEAETRMRLARAETTEGLAAERHARAIEALAALEHAPEEGAQDPTVEAELRRSRLESARFDRDRLAESAPDLAAAEAALERARSVARGAEEEAQALRLELARLDTVISQSAGDAAEEDLADTRARLESARVAMRRLEFEVKVLQRLETALAAASTEARERYFEPVAAELKPLLGLLWPDAELVWEDATLLPRALVRDGQEEDVGILSGGTQEQLALLVRLAFARMLAAQGRHAPVILDDALVFTDDDRIERMFDALHRQAGDLQIIVLSCRQRAFRDLGGRKLDFRAAGP